MEYIHAHYEEARDLEQLSGIANFSRFHFHRQLTACTGIPVYRLIQILRLNHACRQLAFSPERRIVDIALEAGFKSPEAFPYRHLGNSIVQGDWIMAGFDLTALACGLLFGSLYVTRPRRKSSFWSLPFRPGRAGAASR
jgi:AraC-like DNA-binding protein